MTILSWHMIQEEDMAEARSSKWESTNVMHVYVTINTYSVFKENEKNPEKC